MQATGYDTRIANASPKISARDRIWKSLTKWLPLFSPTRQKVLSTLPASNWELEEKAVKIARPNNMKLAAYEGVEEYTSREGSYVSPYYHNTRTPSRVKWLNDNKDILTYLNMRMGDEDVAKIIANTKTSPLQFKWLDSCGVATQDLLDYASQPAKTGSVIFVTVYANSHRNTRKFNLPESLRWNYQGNLVKGVREEMEKGGWRCFDVLRYKAKSHSCSWMLQMGFTNSTRVWRELKNGSIYYKD